MIELTYGELKDALFCCTVCKDCACCPLFSKNIKTMFDEYTCTHHLLSAAMNCINVMEKDLADMTKKADNWEEQCTMREAELFELRESLDRKDHKAATAKEFAGFVQEWMTYTFPCAGDCDHKVQQVLDVYLNYLKQPKQPTEVKF